MIKSGVSGAVAGVLVLSFVFFSASVMTHAETKKIVKYSGYKTCIKCHEKMDDSVKVWRGEKHAKAFDSLESPAAKKHSKNPAKDKKCLKCHVTGLDKPGGYSVDNSDKDNESLKGVTCQQCHGPSQNYIRAMIKADKDKKTGPEVVKGFVKEGLVNKPDEKTCKQCHNKECPTFKEEFKYKEMLKKISHGKKLK